MQTKQLDLSAVVDELTALNGATVTVEVHAAGGGVAPRAILSGAVGSLSMDDESGGGDSRGLLFVPIGAEGPTDPGSRPGLYFDQQCFAGAEGSGPMTIALEDESFFVIRTQS